MKNDSSKDMYAFENELLALGYKNIAGCDEVGRGPMAGPVVCAAVVLDPNVFIDGLNDSKKLTYKRREELSKEIKEKAKYYEIDYIDAMEVDKINVLEASRKGMTNCVNRLKEVDYILTDAMDLYIDIPCKSIIKGDSLSASIAAASIIAKVERDHYMEEMANIYPEYGFEKHKGYVTKYHLEMIEKYGVSDIHRKSFAPVQRVLEKNALNKSGE